MTAPFANNVFVNNTQDYVPAHLLARKDRAPMSKDLVAVLAKVYTRSVVPQDMPYARVVVNGHVVATLTNHGHVQGNASIRNAMRDGAGYVGPQLAQHRAEQIAEKTGGTVMKAATAQTQAEWYARPVPTWCIDYAQMEDDGYAVPQDFRSTTFRSAAEAEATIIALMEYQA